MHRATPPRSCECKIVLKFTCSEVASGGFGGSKKAWNELLVNY